MINIKQMIKSMQKNRNKKANAPTCIDPLSKVFSTYSNKCKIDTEIITLTDLPNSFR